MIFSLLGWQKLWGSTLVQISCMTLNKCLNLSVLGIPHLQGGKENSHL